MNNTAATLILLDPGKLGGGRCSFWVEDGSFSFFYFLAECGSCNQGIDASRPGCLASGQTSDQVIINLQHYQQIFPPELQYNIFARQVLPPRLLQVPGVLSRDPGRLLHHRDQPRLLQLLQGRSSKSRISTHVTCVDLMLTLISVFKMLGTTEGEIFFMQGQVSLWERLQGRYDQIL